MIPRILRLTFPANADLKVEKIKAVRGLTQWGLKEAKDFVEDSCGKTVDMPTRIDGGIDYATNEWQPPVYWFNRYMKQLTEAGVGYNKPNMQRFEDLKRVVVSAVENNEFDLAIELLVVLTKRV